MASTFAATVGDWVLRVQGGLDAVFRASAQELVSQMQGLLTEMVYNQPQPPGAPSRTGFLRASLRASTTSMPVLSLDNPGGRFALDVGQIELVILNADSGDTIYLGYTAKYGAYVHYGAQGRPPRPWVDMVVQRWQIIVDAKAKELKTRLKL